MLEIVFWVAVGLLVGWNLLPQPKWIRTACCWVVNQVKGLF